MILPLLLSAGLLMSAEAVPAAGGATTPSPAAAPAPPPKKICTTTTDLGSRLPVRICRTPEQAAAIAEASKQALQDMQKVGAANSQ
jgi:hypothetical protein